MEQLWELKFFKSIMERKPPKRDKDEIIQLHYIVTKGELDTPIRHYDCRYEQPCVWPLSELLQQYRKDYLPLFHQRENPSYQCKMCYEQNNREVRQSKRSFEYFYYDRELDYLIRTARQQYRFALNQKQPGWQNQQRLKKRAARNFRNSQLYLYNNGRTVLEYCLRLVQGEEVRYLTTISESSGEGLHLSFDPKDYQRNLTAAKNVQTVIYQALGRSLEKGCQLTEQIISQPRRLALFDKFQALFKDNLKCQSGQKQQSVAVKLVSPNSKVAQLIMFEARTRLTRIYRFQSAPNAQNMFVQKASNNMRVLPVLGHILLVGQEYTFLIPLPPLHSKLKKTKEQFNRSFDSKQGENREILVQIEIKQLLERYVELPKIKMWPSPSPPIQDPFLIQDPQCPSNIFICGGMRQGLPNSHVYRLQKIVKPDPQPYQWKLQDNQIYMGVKGAASIIDPAGIFIVGGIKVPILQNKKSSSLFSLTVKQNNLVQEKQFEIELQKQIGNVQPLRVGKGQYLLIPLDGRFSDCELDVQTKKIIQKSNLSDSELHAGRKLIEGIGGRERSWPGSGCRYNQIDYQLLVSGQEYEVLAGCGDQWFTNNLQIAAHK